MQHKADQLHYPISKIEYHALEVMTLGNGGNLLFGCGLMHNGGMSSSATLVKRVFLYPVPLSERMLKKPPNVALFLIYACTTLSALW